MFLRILRIFLNFFPIRRRSRTLSSSKITFIHYKMDRWLKKIDVDKIRKTPRPAAQGVRRMIEAVECEEEQSVPAKSCAFDPASHSFPLSTANLLISIIIFKIKLI